MKPLTEQSATVIAHRRADRSLTRVEFLIGLLLIVGAALALRLVYPVADPPTEPGVGIVWHDEGAWVHNARNRALFGAWKLDEWNPMYVTPVLTGLEYVSFALLGVGLRQARLVPELLGALSVLLIGLGVSRAANNRLAGLIASALLATDFVFVMYNRAATIEGTMVACLVIAWYGYARAGDTPRWGIVAGFGAVLAYFTKASAVFFVAALAFDAALSLLPLRVRTGNDSRSPDLLARRAALYTIAGLAIAGALALVLFVLPNWPAYTFYNWQMSVTRKPSYGVKAFLDRASQLPLVADFFTRMWPVVVVALAGVLARVAGWRRVPPAERLLFWWLGLGLAELILHDVQERRLVMLIPAMVALAAMPLGRCTLAPEVGTRRAGASVWMAAPVVFYALYMMAAPVVRLPFLARLDPGAHPGPIVRTAALLALAGCVALCATRERLRAWAARQQWRPALSLVVAGLIACGGLAQFGQWAVDRTDKNYTAMVRIGQWLPPGTLVHGKLANGLALENRIRPVFVGRGFGNYADRTHRDDIRYVVTYISPFIGYEGGRDAASGRSIIWDVLDAYPNRRVLHVFDVAESPEGHDAAVLIDKQPGQPAAAGHGFAAASGNGR